MQALVSKLLTIRPLSFPVSFSGLSRTSLMTTGKARLVVREPEYILINANPEPPLVLAAFLTQTVTLEDNTTIKFEIW